MHGVSVAMEIVHAVGGSLCNDANVGSGGLEKAICSVRSVAAMDG